MQLEYVGGGRHYVPDYPARDLECDEATAEKLLSYKPPVYRVKEKPTNKDSGGET